MAPEISDNELKSLRGAKNELFLKLSEQFGTKLESFGRRLAKLEHEDSRRYSANIGIFIGHADDALKGLRREYKGTQDETLGYKNQDIENQIAQYEERIRLLHRHHNSFPQIGGRK